MGSNMVEAELTEVRFRLLSSVPFAYRSDVRFDEFERLPGLDGALSAVNQTGMQVLVGRLKPCFRLRDTRKLAENQIGLMKMIVTFGLRTDDITT